MTSPCTIPRRKSLRLFVSSLQKRTRRQMRGLSAIFVTRRVVRHIISLFWVSLLSQLLLYLYHKDQAVSRSFDELMGRERFHEEESPSEAYREAFRRCASSRTFVDFSKYSLTAFQCINSSGDGRRHVLNCSSRPRRPPLLWTVPGAGNTWVRNLLEQAAGTATGSVYNDTTLQNVFLGEAKCDDNTLCVKAHPSTHPFELISNVNRETLGNTLPQSMLTFRNSVTKSTSVALRRYVTFGTNCRSLPHSHHLSTTMQFTRALIVDRHPLEAAFAEVQRLTILRQGKRADDSHVLRLPRNFRSTVNERVWNRLCKDYLNIGRDYVLAWYSYVQFVKRFGKEAVLIARYEDLRDPRKRQEVLREMLGFLGVPLVTGSSECAFARSEDSRIHRAREYDSATHANSKHRGSTSMDLINFLSSDFMGNSLFEWMWKIIGVVAEARGYHAPKSFRYLSYQNLSSSAHLDVNRFLEFQASTWYNDEDQAAVLEALGFKSSSQSPDQRKRSPEALISSEYASCVEKAWVVKRNNRVVLMFAGNPSDVSINDRRSIFPVLLNSLLWLRRGGIREFLVVCFEKEYDYILRSLNINTCYLKLHSFNENDGIAQNGYERNFLSRIYTKRLDVIETILRTGVDIVHSDIDAVWTRNALEVLEEYHTGETVERDIVASRGTFPHREAVSWGGSTLCMGLISLRANVGVLQVLRTARQKALQYHGDDQIGLNRGLADLGVQWSGHDPAEGKVVLLEESRIWTLRVSLVSNTVVRRNCVNKDKVALIMHCFDKHNDTIAEMGAKEAMKWRGMWLLREDWLDRLIHGETAEQTADKHSASIEILEKLEG